MKKFITTLILTVCCMQAMPMAARSTPWYTNSTKVGALFATISAVSGLLWATRGKFKSETIGTKWEHDPVRFTLDTAGLEKFDKRTNLFKNITLFSGISALALGLRAVLNK